MDDESLGSCLTSDANGRDGTCPSHFITQTEHISPPRENMEVDPVAMRIQSSTSETVTPHLGSGDFHRTPGSAPLSLENNTGSNKVFQSHPYLRLNMPHGDSMYTFKDSKSCSIELGYIDQLQKFPKLPLDAHRKIQQMGNDIVHYFEARLIHVEENPKIIEAFDSHVAFLKSPTTAQHWVMAFVKDEDNRVHIKFNRLLTVHIRAVMQNPLTVEIEPSKSPHRAVNEQFIFNFENQRVCTEFLRVLNVCKKEIWTRRSLPLARKSWSANAISSLSMNTSRRLDGASFGDRKLRCKSQSSTRCSPGFMFETLENTLRRVPPSSLNSEFDKESSSSSQEDSAAPLPKLLRFPYRMKFNLKYSAVLSVRKDKKSSEYGALGMGTLRIWGNDDCFDVLDFTGRHSNERVCSHPIYAWNTISMTSDEVYDEHICHWTAAADILAAPTSLPSIREFKVVFPSKEVASSFKVEFEKSCSKASKPEIIFHAHYNMSNWYPDVELVSRPGKNIATPPYSSENVLLA